MRFHRTLTDGRWATTPVLAGDIENDDALPCCAACEHGEPCEVVEDCAPASHVWAAAELLPETMCDRCGLRYGDWTATP